MNHTCLSSPAAEHHRTLAGTHFPPQWGQKAELALIIQALLEVAPTALRLVLLIYSFQFRSAFAPRCRNWFSRFTLTFSWKGTLSLRDLELWPMTLTHVLDVDKAKMKHSAKCLGQMKVISLESYCPDTDTHTRQIHCTTRLVSGSAVVGKKIPLYYMWQVARWCNG